MMWFARKKPTDLAKRIATCFRCGKIVHRDLNSHGISELAIDYRGQRIRLSWYSTGSPRSFAVDGNTSFPKGVDSLFIFKAAWARADRLVDEDLDGLRKL